jgi:hypothetical protein
VNAPRRDAGPPVPDLPALRAVLRALPGLTAEERARYEAALGPPAPAGPRPSAATCARDGELPELDQPLTALWQRAGRDPVLRARLAAAALEIEGLRRALRRDAGS